MESYSSTGKIPQKKDHLFRPPYSVTWESPSNIALIKYWGKKGPQIPANPSLSFTLKKAVTRIELKCSHRIAKEENSKKISLIFTFKNEPNPKFQEKIENYLESLLKYYPFLEQLDLTINSSATFPAESGIASSASSMSALALCLCSLENAIFGTLENRQNFLKKASYLARLGSGSACRSVYGGVVSWGENSEIDESNDLFSQHLEFDKSINPIFRDFQNAILIISSKKKKLSSREGHDLMEQHPFAQTRYQHAHKNLSILVSTLKSGDLNKFGEIVENEALELHGLMMSSWPDVILMEPATLKVITEIRKFRKLSNQPVYFTMDAGPNIHLLYPKKIKATVDNFINDKISPFLENGRWIADEIGDGPTLVSN